MLHLHHEIHLIGSAHDVQFSPDGQRLAIVNSGKAVVIIYDVKSWDVVLEIHEPLIAFAFLDFYGQIVAIGTMQGMVKIWENGAFIKTKQLHNFKIDKIRVLKDKLVSMSYLLREVALWNLKDDVVTRFHQKFCNLPHACSESANLMLLEDGILIDLYDLTTATTIATIDITHFKVLKSVISPDSRYIACLCDNQTIRLFELNGKKVAEINHIGSDATIISFDSHSQHLIIAFEDGRHLHFWDIETQNETHKIPYPLDNIRAWSISAKQKIAIASTSHFLTHSIVEIWSLE